MTCSHFIEKQYFLFIQMFVPLTLLLKFFKKILMIYIFLDYHSSTTLDLKCDSRYIFETCLLISFKYSSYVIIINGFI